MSDQERLAGYVEVWWQSIDDFTRLLEKVPAEQWATPTDLAGWDVHAVAAHIAHLETLTAGGEHDNIDIGEPVHVRGMMGTFTEQGVVARREESADALITQIRSATTQRHTSLLAEPPTDGAAPAPGLFGAIGWNTNTLLRNRPLDVWMHEQDVRRAVGQPGGMDSPGAQHTADYLSEAFGFVVAKKAGAPAGTTALLQVEGSAPIAFVVNEGGRGERLTELPEAPTVTLSMDRESFIFLAGGRRAAEAGRVQIEGDQALGEQIVGAMATTP